ncbi:hypothetical protein ACFY97_18910 [Streptomyces klenkii]|uniref:hypothetical protein n=1 Tax=Streptomyces klenkii TaxID=1420899 RepID=UPI0036EBC1E6
MAIPGNFLSTTTESVDPNTSGWVAKLNCTISLGSGGRNGDGCLAVKSSASGEMQARTVSSYEVVPWTEYHAFCDASGATVPERIGIRWLDASNAEISITWSLTTATASTTWHRIAVGGEAPGTAARAQVVVSSTPAASNVFSYYENFYFGFPVVTTGNKFAFNTENSEIDASGWFNEVNSTVARQAPMVSWAVDYYLAGGQVAAMTATANGNSSMRSTDRPDATPGVEYAAYCYLNPPTSGSVTWVELRFYDVGGSQIAATRSTLAAPGTGWYREYASAVAPAGTAACSIAVGIDTATAGQVLRVDNAVVSTAPVLRAGSVLPYADASFEQGVAGWTVVSGVATITRSTPWGSFSFDAAYAGTVTSSTATTSVIRSAKFALPAGAAGQSFRTEVYSNVSAGGFNLTRGIRWYDASNTDLGLTSGSSAAIPTPNWWLIGNTFTAPANATQAAIEYTVTATTTSSVWRIDRIALWESLPLTAVEGHDDTASVTLTLRELTAGQYITIYRVTPDGTRTLVRGPSGLISLMVIPSDLMVVEDYEAPIGVEVSYYIEIRATLTSTAGTRASDGVTLTAGDENLCWLKDPGQPQRNAMFMVVSPPAWKRSIAQSAYRVRGRRNPVVLSDVRSGLEGDLIIWTRSDEEADALHWLLDSGSALLWQVVPGVHESDLYVTVGEADLPRVVDRADEEWRQWTLPLTQVDMPTTVGVAGTAGRTWQDVLTGFATWGDVPTTYAIWEDVLFDRRNGG